MRPGLLRRAWAQSRGSASLTAADGEQGRLALLVLAAAAVAWLILVFAHAGASSSPFDHSQLGGSSAEHSGGAEHHSGGAEHRREGLVLVGWSVMVVAMMLPPALPLLLMVRRLVGRQPHTVMLTAMAAGAFLLAWIVVGAVLVAGDTALHALTADGTTESWHPLITGAVFLGAGMYQVSPLKKWCLRACRSPRSFALAHWRGYHGPTVEVLAVTSSYALSCIGCCWALMALCFAVGQAALPVMVVLAVLMAAERLVSWGQRLVLPAGLVLMILGAAIALRLLPAGLVTG
jgi:predicted metal-binding membrane protein